MARPDPDPNWIPQDQLFVCDGAPGASPARIRRIERAEWTYNVSKPLAGTWDGSFARNNPFDAPGALPFQSYARDVTIDGPMLDLYFGVLDEAGVGWTARDPRSGVAPRRLSQVYDDRTLRCMFDDAEPDAACVDNYLRRLLTSGVLFRPPSDAELAHLREFTAERLGEEAAGQRQDTLRKVTSAAWLMAGALFRSELGQDESGDGRHRLGDWELAQALAYAIDERAAGASGIFAHQQGPPEHPHWTAPPEGYMGAIVAAAEDGSIQDVDTIKRLFRRYAGGVDPGRFDLNLEYREDRRSRRGEYWIARRMQRFFREWLDYADFAIAFKDTPEATSQFAAEVDVEGRYDARAIRASYDNLKSGYYGDEPIMTQQLDDTIARVVVEDRDVLRTLLTTRRFYLSSNLAYAGSNIERSTGSVHRVYNMTSDVPASRAGRWVTLPADERAGVLTHPAWLAAHGGNFEDDGSLIHRGKWLREQLFCETVPPLESVMVEAKLVERSPERSARDRVAVSLEDNPLCMGCHSQMNSLGYPIEIYNHAGFLRAVDHGRPPDGSSTFDNLPDEALNRPVRDAVEMMTSFAESEHVKRCFIRQSFRYFMGRDETRADACALSEMEAAYDESGGSFLSMIEALVVSDAFRYRTRGAE